MSPPEGLASPVDMAPVVLHVVRHGEAEGPWPVTASSRLTQTGLAQARVAAEALAALGLESPAIRASDLPRCRETAEAIAAELGCTLEFDSRLREMDFGWEGRTAQEILRGIGEDRLRAFLADPAGVQLPESEPFGQFWRRVEAALRDCVRRGRGLALVVVAHDGVNRAIDLLAAGLGPTDWHRAAPWRHGEMRSLALRVPR